MKCPTCTDTALVMTDRQGVEIDYCPQCRGVWLDRGELDKLIDRAGPTASAVPTAVLRAVSCAVPARGGLRRQSPAAAVQSSDPPKPNSASRLVNRLKIDRYRPTVAST